MPKQLEKDTNIWYNIKAKLRKHTKMRCANMSNLINENYISIEDAALFLNIKPVTLRKWIKMYPPTKLANSGSSNAPNWKNG